jgi:uncharacterized protein (TIGR02186 family)
MGFSSPRGCRSSREVPRSAAAALTVLPLLLLLPSGAGATTSPPATPATAITVEPAAIRVDLLYHGTTVHARGSIPAGSEAAMLCVGPEGTLELRRKGRVWGILWMNVGDVVFEHAPSLYLLATSEALGRVASEGTLDRLAIGYAGLQQRVTSSGDPSLFKELVRLKEHERLYKVADGGLRLSPERGGTVGVEGSFFLPARVLPGEYQIRLYSFRDGAGTLVGASPVTLEQAGLASFISSMAHRHGLLYGIVAVVVAMITGLVTGVIFGLGGKRGH